jgi:flagellin
VVVSVSDSATTGQVTFSGATVAAGGATIEVAGNAGTEQLSFSSGTTAADIATAINSISEATGVVASASAGGVSFKSSGYGSQQFVSIKQIAGTFSVADQDGNNDGKDYGADAKVNINGAQADVDGLNVTYRTNNLDVNFTLTTTDATYTTGGLNQGKTASFGITGGGATFALGSKVTETDKASIGIGSVSTGSLGSTDEGFLSSLGSGGPNSLSSGNLVTAQKVLDKAIKQVSQLRGRLGAFQKFTIGSTINSLGVAYENASAAQSAIADTDFAQETANLTRNQILVQSATTVLAQANSAPQNALSLLRG